MLDTRIVFLEGLPGIGKSTISQYLSLQISKNGYSTRWFYEGKFDHPTRLCSIGEYPTRALVTQCLVQWKQLVRSALKGRDVLIFDAVLLQCTVLPLYLSSYNQAEIASIINEILLVVKPLNPLLIYLKDDNFKDSQKKLIKRRGVWFGELLSNYVLNSSYGQRKVFEASELLWIQFCEEYIQFLNRLFGLLNLDKLIVNVTGIEKNRIQELILNSLSLNNEFQVYEPEKEIYIGTYRPVTGKFPDINIMAGSDGLIINGLLPWEDLKLLNLSTRIFLVRGWPMRIVYSESLDGFTIEENRTARFNFGRSYVRLG